jgi:hypothetical protein
MTHTRIAVRNEYLTVNVTFSINSVVAAASEAGCHDVASLNYASLDYPSLEKLDETSLGLCVWQYVPIFRDRPSIPILHHPRDASSQGRIIQGRLVQGRNLVAPEAEQEEEKHNQSEQFVFFRKRNMITCFHDYINTLALLRQRCDIIMITLSY